MTLLKINNLIVSAENRKILKGISLKINTGEVHAVMGPNGSGKSTLANFIAGNPRFEIKSGAIYFNEEDLSIKTPEECSLAGIFLSYQNPIEISGVTVSCFLRTAYNLRRAENPVNAFDFRNILKKEIREVGLPENFLDRYVNEGFSGGEKKKLEILQMRILKPKLAILDEIDSGLDIDALQIVSKSVNDLRKSDTDFSALIITHYRRILDYIKPDRVHIMLDGRIVKSDGAELIELIEKKGYKQFSDKNG